MHIKRIYGLASLLAACGMLGGCCGDSCCRGGGSRTTLPPVNPAPAAAAGTATPPSGWTNPPRAQDPNSMAPLGTQQPTSGLSAPATGLGNTNAGTPLPTTSSATPANSSSVDTMPSMQSPVRTVSGSMPVPAAPNTTNQPSTTQPLTQRDSWPQSSPVTAPPPPTLPPPPPTLPANSSGSSATSRYSPPAPSQPLPPETIPGQSKIPTLPPGPSPVE